MPILLLLTATASAEPRKLTFASAIDLTMQKSPDLAQAQIAVDAAKARAEQPSRKRLPSLNVNAIGNYYTEPYQLMFGPQLFTLHQQRTSITNVQVVQPLTGLAYLSELVGAADHAANAAAADYDKARLDAAYRTATAYLRLLEARAGADIAHQSVTDIQAELEQTQKQRAADAATNIDVLRLQSAKAAADQSAVRADTQVQQAVAALVVQIGLHDGESIDIADDLPPAPPAMALSLDQAIQRGLQARPELRSAKEQIASADDVVTSKKEEYLPSVNAIANWQHTTGLEPFQPKNEEYVGLQVQWRVWDWGSIWGEVKEARANQARAEVAAGALADHVRLEIRQHWLDAKAGFDNLASAATQLQTAEEAYRLQHVKYVNGAATTTDVINAETEVARARVQAAVARYDYYLALVELARSVGDVPNPTGAAPR
ncbi:MAG: TolC family protein [Deltaproteobacteria bacterium]|nr:TolC family protein [Deltaproteobacteria bacterium]